MKYLLFFLLVCQLAFGNELGFIFFGDSGTGDKNQHKTALAMKHYCQKNRCDFGIMLGDNFYPWGVHSVNDRQFKTKFVQPYGPLKFEFRVVLGNHDYWGNVMAQIEYSNVNPQWRMPMPYYKATEKNNDLLINLYSQDTNRFDEKQAYYLKKYIEDDADWKIVFGHHPIYSYGMHGDTKKLIKDMLPIIRKKADFYLSGHDHDRQLLEDEDLVYIVSGAAAKPRSTNKGPKTVWAKSGLGFAHLLLTKDEATFRFIDENANIDFERKYDKN